MPIKLNKDESVFRNELIFTVDAKQINIDHTFVIFFILFFYYVFCQSQRTRRGESVPIRLDKLINIFKILEEEF